MGNNYIHAGGLPKAEFDDGDIILLSQATGNGVAPARIRPNSGRGSNFGLGHVGNGIPRTLAISSGAPVSNQRGGCSVDRNLSRVDVGRPGPGAALLPTFVGDCGEGARLLHVGPEAFELPEAPLRADGLADAGRGLRTFLLRDNVTSPTETAYTIGRIEVGSTGVEYRAPILEVDGETRGRGLSGFNTNGAAISVDGVWAAYALVEVVSGGPNRMRIARLKVR